MPTLNDLRATLHDRAELCDADMLDTLVTIDRPSRAPRRRHAAPLLAAAAVIAVTAAAAAVGAALQHDTGTQAAGPARRPAPTWQFKIADVPGWTVSYDLVDWTDGRDGMPGAWGGAARLTPATGQATVTYGYEPRVEAEYPGNGMGPTSGRGVAVTINGQAGWWAPGRTVDTSSLIPSVASDPWAAVKNSGDWQPRLVWQNPDGSWNALMGTVGYQPKTYSFDNAVARRTMIRIAKAVSLTKSGGAVKLPFSANLDGIFELSEVSSQADAACGEWTTAPPIDDVRICRVVPNEAHSEQLGLTAAAGESKVITRRDLGDGTVLVIVRYGAAGSDVTTADLLDSVDVSPTLDDRSTWLAVGS